MADTIVKSDSGLMGIVLGGLLVWLFIKYRQEAAAEEAAAGPRPGTSVNCGESETINQITPGSSAAHVSETDSGRFISGISPTYN